MQSNLFDMKNNQISKIQRAKKEVFFRYSAVHRAVKLDDSFSAYSHELEIFTYVINRIRYHELDELQDLIKLAYDNSLFYKPCNMGYNEAVFNYKCNVVQDIIKLNDPEKTLLYIHDLCGYILEFAQDLNAPPYIIRKLSQYLLDVIF